MSNWKNYGLILLALALVILLTRGLSCHHNDTLAPAPVVTDTATFEQRVRLAEANSKSRQDSMQRAVEQEKQVTATYKGKLTTAQANNRLMEQIINSLPPGQKDTTGSGPDRETAIQDYIANTRLSDSLCNQTIASQGRTITTKDNQLTEQQLLYSKLRATFDTAMTQHQILIDDDKAVRRAFKRKNFGAKLWKGISIAEALYIGSKLILKK